MEHIINQLFMFSKLDIGEFPLHLECVDLVKVIKNFIDEMEGEYKGRGLSVEINEGLPKVYSSVDVVQFRNVLQNVFENSIKYKDKELVLSEVALSIQQEKVLISISDNGPGVKEESLNRLFDVFYRSDASRKNPGSGSGLGLAISQKIVERSGGSIEAAKAPAGGLTIIIKLPLERGGK